MLRFKLAAAVGPQPGDVELLPGSHSPEARKQGPPAPGLHTAVCSGHGKLVANSLGKSSVANEMHCPAATSLHEASQPTSGQ